MSDFENDTEVVDATAQATLQQDQHDQKEGSITYASITENQRAMETINRLKNEMLEMKEAEERKRIEAEREKDNQIAAVTKRMEELQATMAQLVSGGPGTRGQEGVGLANSVRPTSDRLVTSVGGPGD